MPIAQESNESSDITIEMHALVNNLINSFESLKFIEPVDKKKIPKGPKPGSKKAQLLKQAKTEGKLELPKMSLCDGVLVCLFKDLICLKESLSRPHVQYDGILQGPLKGVNFSMEHYRNWYASVIPTPFETELFELISSKEAIYLIACQSKDSGTFVHEWAHAVYYKDSEYAAFVASSWEALEPAVKIGIQKELAMRRYDPKVYLDEFQAYIVESPAEFGKKFTGSLGALHRAFKSKVNAPVLKSLTFV